MTDYALQFGSYFRRGLAARSSFDAASLRAATTLRGAVLCNGSPAAGADFSKTIHLKGPGDIVGIDPTIDPKTGLPMPIARVYPEPGKERIVAGAFPFVELKDPDFLWRYSIAAPDASKRFRPWLALLVLEQSSFEVRPLTLRIPTAPGKPDRLHAAQVLVALNGMERNGVRTQALPDLNDLWAWAHVQFSDVKDLEHGSEHTCCRLVCPILLERGKRYTAFLVPAFEIGRRAGLGLQFEDVRVDQGNPPTVTHTKVADLGDPRAYWTARPNTELQIPIYYQWELQTDDVPEFEELVDRLRLAEQDEAQIEMVDASRPGYFPHWNSRIDGSFPLETALLPLGYRAPEPPARQQFRAMAARALKGNLIGISLPIASQSLTFGEYLASLAAYKGAKGVKRVLLFIAWLFLAAYKGIVFLFKRLKIRWFADPLVTLPYYGSTYCRQQRTMLDRRGWAADLNLDRRYRVAAGLGTRIVQVNQDAFMEMCFSQPGDIRSGRRVVHGIDGRNVKGANRIIRSARSSSVISATLQERHLDRLSPDRLAMITRPLHTLGSEGTETLRARHAESGLDRGLLSAQARQIIYKKTCVRVDARTLEQTFSRPAQRSAAPGTPVSLRDSVYRSSPLRGDRIEVRSVERGVGKQIVDALGELAKKVLKQVFLVLEEELKDWWRKDQAHPFEIIEPLAWCPKIKMPMYGELRDRMMQYLLPQLTNVENNRVFFLQENRRFIEAFMVGLNHELVREMVWREFPTDTHGTAFQYFWEPREDVPAQISTRVREVVAKIIRERCGADAEKLFNDAYPLPENWVPVTVSLDASASIRARLAEILLEIDYHAYIKEIARRSVDDSLEAISGWFRQPGGEREWGPTALGANAPEWTAGANRFVVGIKGDLIRQVSHPLVFLAKKDAGESLDAVLDRMFQPGAAGVHAPEVQAVIGKDLLLLGFPVSAEEVQHDKDDWVFVISEMPSLPRFGLDKPETVGSAAAPAVELDDVRWAEVEIDPASRWITRFKDFRVTTTNENISWGTINSATIANLTLQQPSRLVFPLSRIEEA
jgi:hypothetical protein